MNKNTICLWPQRGRRGRGALLGEGLSDQPPSVPRTARRPIIPPAKGAMRSPSVHGLRRRRGRAGVTSLQPQQRKSKSGMKMSVQKMMPALPGAKLCAVII